MSVINQMLRDLDQQKQGVATAKPARIQQAVRVTSKRWLWLLIIALVLIIILQQYLLPSAMLPETSAQLTPKVITEGPRAMAGAETPPLADQQVGAEQSGQTPASLTPVTTLPAAPGAAEPLVAAKNASLAKSQSLAKEPAATLASPLPTAAPIGEPVAQPVKTPIRNTDIQRESDSLDEPTQAVSAIVQADAVDNRLADVVNATSTFTENVEAVMPASNVQVQRLSPEQQQQLWQQQAEQAISEGRYAHAELLLRQWRQVDPQQALPQLAELYWQRQQSLQLDAVLAESRDLAIVDARLERLALYRLQQQQRWPELLNAITDDLVTRYGAEVLALKAQGLWQTAQYQAALLAYQQWTALTPNEARAWLGQALVLEQLAQPKAARAAYQQALQRGGLSPASLQFIQQRLVALPE